MSGGPTRRSPAALVLSAPVWLYRKVISPMKPPTCRFDPTCSQYALEALKEHGALRGAWLTARRLARCHPWCEPGHDPVPPRPADVTPSPPAGTDRSPRSPA